MKIQEIGSTEYRNLFCSSFIPYNTVLFNELISHKCDKLRFLLFSENKIKLGLIAGIEGKKLISPFSAPFACFSFLDSTIQNICIIDALKALEEFSITNGLKDLRFTLPPYFYCEHFISKLIFCFHVSRYSPIVNDNHFFLTRDYKKYENGTIKRGVQYNIRCAIKAGLYCSKANKMSEYLLAYSIIKENKDSLDRVLNITFEHLLEMKSLVDVEFYIVYLNDEPIASSVVYIYSSRIAQIIYWGELITHKKYYPMNFLAMSLFRTYYERGFDIIDLGNASVQSLPNHGLTNFKEIIGCTASVKYSFMKNL